MDFERFCELFLAGEGLESYGGYPDHVRRATAAARSHPHNIHFLSYEELRANTAASLAQVLEFISITRSSDDIARAIALCDRNEMARAEQSDNRLMAAFSQDGGFVAPENAGHRDLQVPDAIREGFEALDQAGPAGADPLDDVRTTPRTVLLSGYFGAQNYGDEAGRRMLTQALIKAGFGVTVGCLDPSKIKSPGGATLYAKAQTYDRLQKLRSADVVIVGPGGLLKRPRGRAWPSLVATGLFDAMAAGFLGAQVIVFSVSAPSAYSRIDKMLLRLALGQSTVFARDKRSARAFKDARLNVVESADIVFAAEQPISSQEPATRISVAIAPSASDIANSPGAGALLDDIARLLSEAQAAGSIGPVDAVLCQPADLAYVKRCIVIGLDVGKIHDWSAGDVAAARKSLLTTNLMVAHRYHAAVTAALAGCQVVTIGHDPKLVDISSGLGASALHLERLTQDDSLSGIWNKLAPASSVETVALSATAIQHLELLIEHAATESAPRSVGRRAACFVVWAAALGTHRAASVPRAILSLRPT